MPKDVYPHLRQLFGGYMHQDWCNEGKDWPDLVRNFSRCESIADPSIVATEIEQLLASAPNDAALHDHVYREMNCYYDPRPDLGGPTVREWLTQVAAFLRLSGPTGRR
ncbi:MAG: contact-dependent growth inhibition system immunity protein [Pirellulaceae bacterium]